MCDFKPGDEVICVVGAAPHTINGRTYELIVGQAYTIAAVAAAGQRTDMGRIGSGEPHVQLVEFGHVETPKVWGVLASRFRRVQRRDLSAWLETAATNTDRWDKPIKAPAPLHPVPSVDALFRRIMAGGDR